MYFYLPLFSAKAQATLYVSILQPPLSAYQDYNHVSLCPALIILSYSYTREWTKLIECPELNVSSRMTYRFLKKSLFIFYFMCIHGFSECMHVKHVCPWCPQKSSKDIGLPSIGVKMWLWMPCGICCSCRRISVFCKNSMYPWVLSHTYLERSLPWKL